MGVRHDREAEVGRQAGADRLPRAAAVVRAEHPDVVLRVQAVGIARVDGHLVHALAELGRLSRQELGGVRDDRVDRLPAEVLAPLRAVRVVPQAAHQLEDLAAVVGPEQRGRLRAGPHHVTIGRRRLQLPDALDRYAKVLGEPDRAAVRLVPGGAGPRSSTAVA
jgi:hypothetical protein